MTVEMTNEIRCPGCGRALRLSKEHAGKQIRCPACQQVCVAPPALDELDPGARQEHQSQADSNDPTWYLRPPDGPMYGPVHRSELAQWAQEGRITADCELGESAVGPWHPADSAVVEYTDAHSGAGRLRAGDCGAGADSGGRVQPGVAEDDLD